MQLINNNIFMKDPIKNKIIKENEVFEKFGVYPEKVIDVQSLAGDSVDNIPGAPGIGIKTAALLVNQFGSLKGILNDFKKIKQNKRREAIEFNIENIAISKKLVELKKDVKVEINIDKISSSDFDKKKLLEFFKKYNFENLKTKIENFDGLKSEENNGKNIQVSYRTILKKEELIDVVKKITETGYVAIDTETNSIKPFGANLIGISLSWNLGEACYIPILHSSLNKNLVQLKKETVTSVLNPVLEDSSILKIGQNIKFDKIVLFSNGFTKINSVDDTMLMSYTLYAGLHNHNLDLLSKIYLGIDKIKYKDIIGTGKKEISFSDVSVEEATKYSCEDADFTLRLWKRLRKSLMDNKLMSVYHNIEKPLIDVISNMEIAGIKVDKKNLKNLSKEFEEEIIRLQKDIYLLSGEEFNINSPKQLGDILFENMKLPYKKKISQEGFQQIRKYLNNCQMKVLKLLN